MRGSPPVPKTIGMVEVGGIDLNKPRMRWVAEAVIASADEPAQPLELPTW
jgi:hypothetical protein